MMKLEDLEVRLSKGEQWGFIKETGTQDYLGWILLSKRNVPPGIILDPNEGERYLRLKAEMQDRVEKPYHLKIVELNQDVHESGVYESSEDYRLMLNYYYLSLIEAKNKIEELGFSLDNIKNRFEIDAP